MEELILVTAFAVIALIAMSQCAHHSSRRREKRYLPPTQGSIVEVQQSLGQSGTSELVKENVATAVVMEPERKKNVGHRQ